MLFSMLNKAVIAVGNLIVTNNEESLKYIHVPRPYKKYMDNRIWRNQFNHKHIYTAHQDYRYILDITL